LPGGAPQGTWSYDLGTLIAGDGITKTLSLYGIDEAGNRTATPLAQTFRLDNVAPVITPTQQLSASIISGVVRDGSGILALRAIVTAPDGSISTSAIATTAGSGGALNWTYTPSLGTAGTYTVFVSAEDLAGNTSSIGPFSFEGTNSPTSTPTTTPVVTNTPTTTPTD